CEGVIGRRSVRLEAVEGDGLSSEGPRGREYAVVHSIAAKIERFVDEPRKPPIGQGIVVDIVTVPNLHFVAARERNDGIRERGDGSIVRTSSISFARREIEELYPANIEQGTLGHALKSDASSELESVRYRHRHFLIGCDAHT